MSEVSQGDGWWEASDGKWYPPERHPDYTRPAQVPPAAAAAPRRRLIGRDDTRHEQLKSRQSGPDEFSAPLEASSPLPSSVHGWKPVRRKRIDDRIALRKGALVGLSIATVSWVLYAGFLYIFRDWQDPYSVTLYVLDPYIGFDLLPDFSQPPLVLTGLFVTGLFVAALVAGWLAARAATNSRAGLSAIAACGSVFVASVVVAFAALLFFVLTNFSEIQYAGGISRIAIRIPINAGFYAILVLPFGIIGWLIGRPRPLSVAATASLDLSQEAASDQLMLLLSGLRNQRVERPTLSTVSLRLRFFPGWSILLSLLLFPLGILAAIAAQREETGTIILNEAGHDSSTLQVRGLFDEAACTRIEAFLKQHAASKEIS